MGASENTKFQVSFYSADQTLINLYAASKEELEALLTTAQDFSALIGSVVQSYKGARAAAPIYASKPQSSPEIGEQFPPARPAGDNTCKHGAMVYREGVSAKGPWKGYMCNAPKGATDKCKTIWVK